MSQRELKALQSKDIHEGDTVRTAYRGGVREGRVKTIVDEKGPKVVFTRKRKGQADKEVAHRPSTLEKVTPNMRDEDSEELATHKRAARGSARGGKKGAAAEKGGGGAAAKKGGAGSGTSKAKAGGGAKKAAAAGGKKGGGQVAAKPTRHSTRKTAGRRKEPTEPATPKARASKRSRR